MPSHLHHKIMGNLDEDDSADDEADSDGDGADHDAKLKETGGPGGCKSFEKEQEGYPKETGDLHLWGHHLGCETVDDSVLRDAGRQTAEGDGYVSFVFSLQVDERGCPMKKSACGLTNSAVHDVGR